MTWDAWTNVHNSLGSEKPTQKIVACYCLKVYKVSVVVVGGRWVVDGGWVVGVYKFFLALVQAEQKQHQDFI